MKIVIDYDMCQGHGNCEGDAPEVFQLDDDGNVQILQKSPPEELRAKVELAVKYCPTRAIRIDEG